MKKTWMMVLGFALLLAALLGVALLAQPRRPADEAEDEPAEGTEQAEQKPAKELNAMNEAGATLIELDGATAHAAGLGVSAAGGVVTIGYPGTYRVTGALTDGQLVVDLGDFDGAVYLLLDGASVACSDGPALHVRQADRTVLHLVEGTESTFSDGAVYTIVEKQSENAGAGIYSADDLYIEGGGALTVYGRSADGIRSRDGLTVTGGTIAVYSSDDALQASDYVSIAGGALTLGCYGDGVNVTDGFAAISGGSLDVTCVGDGVSAAAALTVTGGEISVLAYGGADNYAEIAMGDLSAKGLKAEHIALSGGALTLDTADDAVHARGDIVLSGGEVAILSGDDALHAGGALTITGGTLDVTRSYEALEGTLVSVEQGVVTAAAERNGVDAGEDGFVMTGGLAVLTAPRCVGSDGAFSVTGGRLYLSSDGSREPLAFVEGAVSGGTVAMCSAVGDEALLTGRGELPGSLLFLLPGAVEAGAQLTLTDASGAVVQEFATAQDCAAALFAGGALRPGGSYTLTAGDFSLSGTVSDGCTVVGAQAVSAQTETTAASGASAAGSAAAAGGASGGMAPGGMLPGGMPAPGGS